MAASSLEWASSSLPIAIPARYFLFYFSGLFNFIKLLFEIIIFVCVCVLWFPFPGGRSIAQCCAHVRRRQQGWAAPAHCNAAISSVSQMVFQPLRPHFLVRLVSCQSYSLKVQQENARSEGDSLNLTTGICKKTNNNKT